MVAPTVGGDRPWSRVRARPRALAGVQVARIDAAGSPRATVAALVAKRLGVDPGEVRIAADAVGKPRIVHPKRASAFDFSVSHCGSRCIAAISERGAVGIDLELVRPIGDLDRIAQLYFTPAEARRVAAAHGQSKTRAFFACWTGKEAYTKALATGLSTAPDSFALPPDRAGAQSVCWTTVGGRAWTLWRFEPWPGYSAAVVAAGHRRRSALHLRDGDGVHAD